MANLNGPSKLEDPQDITGEMLEILMIITNQGAGVEVQDLANKLKISRPKVEYYLDELGDRKFVRSSHSMVDGTYFYPTKEGRKYLFEKGLL